MTIKRNTVVPLLLTIGAIAVGVGVWALFHYTQIFTPASMSFRVVNAVVKSGETFTVEYTFKNQWINHWLLDSKTVSIKDQTGKELFKTASLLEQESGVGEIPYIMSTTTAAERAAAKDQGSEAVGIPC